MAFLAAGLKTLFFSLVCLVVATWVYVICTVGLTFQDFLTQWMAATFIDFYINVFPLLLWVVYKESNLLCLAIWIILLICCGRLFLPGMCALICLIIVSVYNMFYYLQTVRKVSMGACAYIYIQLLKLSPQESAEDPIYHVLLRPEHKSYEVQKGGKHTPVVTARIVFTILGAFMVATLIYSAVTDGSPFRKDIFTPWMSATLIDMYANVFALSVWVAYKETSWLSTSIWIVLLIFPGSLATCAFITKQLFQLSSADPIYLVLVKNDSRATGVPLLSSVKSSGHEY